jgi:hypothetical protein
MKRGRGARPDDNAGESSRGLQRIRVLTRINLMGLPPQEDMRMSWPGKQASGEGESYAQDANVAETDKARRLMSNLRHPIINDIPTMTKRYRNKIENDFVFILYPATRNLTYGSSVTGGYLNFAFDNPSPSVLDKTGQPAHVKESERSLRQWLNCHLSNAGTDYDLRKDRQVDCQCHSRGSMAVVVGGVTTTQGDDSTAHRAKGHRFNLFHDIQSRTDKPPYHGDNL